MNYAEKLRNQLDSRNSAFLEYVQQRGRFPGHLFVFVEDRDDIRFFDHFCRSVGDMVFFACGGKQNIFLLYNRIHDTPNSVQGATAFIVDRDLDEDYPLFHENEILRTSKYSWESHAVGTELASRLFSQLSNPPTDPAQTQAALEYLSATLAAFGDVLRQHSCSIYASSRLGGGFGLEEWPVTQDALVEDKEIQPGPNAKAWIEHKMAEIAAVGDGNFLLEKAGELLHGEASQFAHGRILFRLFKFACQRIKSALHLEFLIEISSPLSLCLAMPNNWPELNYAREYLLARKQAVLPAL